MISVIVARAVPDHLRGYLGRFLSEVVPGVFVGRTTSSVSDRLWERTTKELATGAMTMVITDSIREQGYSIRVAGTDPPEAIDLDGLQLIATRYSGGMVSSGIPSTKSSDG